MFSILVLWAGAAARAEQHSDEQGRSDLRPAVREPARNTAQSLARRRFLFQTVADRPLTFTPLVGAQGVHAETIAVAIAEPDGEVRHL